MIIIKNNINLEASKRKAIFVVLTIFILKYYPTIKLMSDKLLVALCYGKRNTLYVCNEDFGAHIYGKFCISTKFQQNSVDFLKLCLFGFM